jgi:hypothetical protein
MSIYRVLSAIVAAALGAAVMMAMPGFSPAVEAGVQDLSVKTDRLDYRPAGPECTQQAWPYYRADCLHDRTRAAGETRVVRVVSADRLPK